MPRIVTITLSRPPLAVRLRWHLQQARLYTLKPFSKRMTAEEWYTAQCPPYAGQSKPWM